VSGQGPTPQTATNCATFANFKSSGKGKFGQLLGSGCVYPSQTETIASQLSASKYGGWKAYIEGMNDAGSGRERTCNHPPLGAADGHPSPTAADPYVTWTNPFVYFHGLLGSACKQDDVPLTRLATDLKQTATTPALSYIAPSPCDDGNAQPCRPGAAAGLAPAETFLKTIVPEIERSAAYKADGMIAITFAQAPQSGPSQDTTGCAACDPQTYPNLRAGTTTTPSATTTTSSTTTTPTTTTTTPTTTTTTPTTTTTTTTTLAATPTGPSGGGQVGLLVISKYMKAGSVDVTDDFDHYSLLASIEKLFGLKTLGYAHDIALPVFSATTYNAGLP
jgi:hypothetical protein